MDSETLESLLEKAAAGDAHAWQQIVARVNDRLRRMVVIRIDQRVIGRVDPSDVLQETYIDAFNQIAEYWREKKYPVFIWLRLLTGHRLNKLHRFHLGTQQRDASRELSLFQQVLPEASSVALAAHLIGREQEPEQIARRAELILRVHEALNQLSFSDREVLSMRHFEGLTTAESALELGITEAAAGQRYLRALQKIRDVMKDVTV